MSEPQATTEMPQFNVEDQLTVLNALLNGVMQGTMKPDAAKAALGILHHPLEGVELAIKAHRAGLTIAPRLAQMLGLNGGMPALPGTNPGTESDSTPNSSTAENAGKKAQ
jgi:hypothetical protein